MNISFKKLKIHNFLSFGDAEVELDNSSYTLVSGINNCKSDLAKSNGSGKSSIWESIVWCLTGETIRGTKDVINKYGTDGTFAELIYNIDKDEYKITRYKEYSNIGTNLKVIINNEDKSGKGIRDTEKLLEQYLPDITGSLLGSVIILGQGLPQRFTNNTPSGRKEVLEKLSKSDYMIEDIKNKLSLRKTTLNQDLRKSEDSLLEKTSKKTVYENNLVSLKESFKSMAVTIDYDSVIEGNQNQITALKEKQSNFESDIKAKEKELEEARQAYQSFDATLNNRINQLKETYNEQLNCAKNDYFEKDSEYKVLQNEIKKYQSVVDVCPTCGQKLLDVHKFDTTNLERQAAELKKIKDTLQTNLNNLEQNLDTQIQDIKNSSEAERKILLNAGQTYKKDFDKLNSDLSLVKSEITSLEKEIAVLQIQKESFYKEYNKCENDIKLTEEAIEKLNEEILYNNTEKDNIESHYEVVNKMLTIATRDFRGFLLSEVIKFINQKAKEYCKEIFDTEEVEFKLDGNNIYIGYCGKQYENLSGGEKQKIDLIVQFSIRDMLSQFLDFSSNILVLDEIFDNLDVTGCQRVLNLISNKLTDINSIFIITHHGSELDIPYDRELVIVKDENGISKILG